MVTEKECEKAFSDLLVARYVFKQETEKYADDSLTRRFNKAIYTFAKLIDEHFSNPSLEWNEIENGKIIFDKKIKEFVKVKDKRIMDGRKYISLEIIKGMRTYERVFEPYRYYRKEVHK